MSMRIEVREPQAGIWGFYPIHKDKLIREIEKAFLDMKRGPGALPQKGLRKELEVVGGVAPHAGYSFSGACAGWFYKELAENMPSIDIAIIIGTNHTGFGGSITTTTYFSRWATPLGETEVDIDFLSELKRAYGSLDDDVLPHMREHSIEVQLPFLQYIYGAGFKIAPIVVKDIDFSEAKDLAKALHEVIVKTNKKSIVIASSDFTHHGSIYGYVVYTDNVSENVRRLDMMFINRILELDTKGFLDLIYKYNATVCGYGAIAIAMEYAKLANAKAKLLKYYHSGDVTGEEDIIVGYASIVFYREL